MKTISYIGAAISFIIAAILIIFGVLFILGAFSPQGQVGWIGTGVIIVIIGLVFVGVGIAAVIYASRRAPASEAGQPGITLNVDLPASVSMDTLKCESCGGTLTKDNIEMVAGAPVVTCPYCNTVYQLTEEPKW